MSWLSTWPLKASPKPFRSEKFATCRPNRSCLFCGACWLLRRPQRPASELFSLSCLRTQDFVMLVLLCGSLATGAMSVESPWDMIEFFSGRGRLSRMAAHAGLHVAAYEITMSVDEPSRKRNPMFPKRQTCDFNGECGFAPLGETHPLWPCHSRLAIILVLQGEFGKLLVHLAPPCSTWIGINRGTSKRTILCPAGDESLLQNRKSNKIAARPSCNNICPP